MSWLTQTRRLLNVPQSFRLFSTRKVRVTVDKILFVVFKREITWCRVPSHRVVTGCRLAAERLPVDRHEGIFGVGLSFPAWVFYTLQQSPVGRIAWSIGNPHNRHVIVFLQHSESSDVQDFELVFTDRAKTMVFMNNYAVNKISELSKGASK